MSAKSKKSGSLKRKKDKIYYSEQVKTTPFPPHIRELIAEYSLKSWLTVFFAPKNKLRIHPKISELIKLGDATGPVVIDVGSHVSWNAHHW